MTNLELQDQVYDFINGRRGVSFVELGNEFSEWWKGDIEFLKEDKNIVFWSGISKDAFDTLIALLESKRIKMVPTTILVYLADGEALRYPLAKSNRTYKKPRWCPVVFNSIPIKERP